MLLVPAVVDAAIDDPEALHALGAALAHHPALPPILAAATTVDRAIALAPLIGGAATRGGLSAADAVVRLLLREAAAAPPLAVASTGGTVLRCWLSAAHTVYSPST